MGHLGRIEDGYIVLTEEEATTLLTLRLHERDHYEGYDKDCRYCREGYYAMDYLECL